MVVGKGCRERVKESIKGSSNRDGRELEDMQREKLHKGGESKDVMSRIFLWEKTAFKLFFEQKRKSFKNKFNLQSKVLY